MSDINNLLSKGLAKGYAGSTQREKVSRGNFTLDSSEFSSEPGEFYIDQWIADKLGGGQEIAEIGEIKATRLYAGGVANDQTLESLNISKDDVTGKLIQFIQKAKEKTRLVENYEALDADWQYSYKIIKTPKEIGVQLTITLETITYKGITVFAHGFLLSPIE